MSAGQDVQGLLDPQPATRSVDDRIEVAVAFLGVAVDQVVRWIAGVGAMVVELQDAVTVAVGADLLAADQVIGVGADVDTDVELDETRGAEREADVPSSVAYWSRRVTSLSMSLSSV